MQAAVELEFATIPVYLCEMWSIEEQSGTLSLGYGAHQVGRYSAEGAPLRVSAAKGEAKKAVKKRAA